ncbi:hypothetical protein J1N35_043633 [Gossypium stocksii]|uniref:Small nuclear ribonucleoprotein Prp3 C-terminal domain-containing protein n=1 Tax=Gossypium stocksii TaxID=47602 RepID=A0A9D3ZF79_9ROSI|nr:hypothetical protein J1N35_043633 [Gossypium stocksii]
MSAALPPPTSINDLSRLKTRFKVDVNAQENRLTSCVVISEGISAVIVEGGSKSVKRFSVHECITEATARKVFADAGVGHYWDLAVNFTDDEF